jgi:hypothetical protein
MNLAADRRRRRRQVAALHRAGPRPSVPPVSIAIPLTAVVLSSFLIACEARPRAIVVDDFESGAITGWQAVGGGSGGWFVYADGHRAPDPAQSDPNAPSMSPNRPRAGSRRSPT